MKINNELKIIESFPGIVRGPPELGGDERADLPVPALCDARRACDHNARRVLQAAVAEQPALETRVVYQY